MIVMLKKIGKKSVSVVTAAVVAGVGVAAVTFAAIPNSNTGVIAGCRSTVNGTLRAIDTQAGATCGLLEAPISIAAPEVAADNSSALLRLKPDPQNQNNYVIDTARSRNITKVDTIADPDPNNTGYRALCIEVKFDPEVSITTPDQGQVGGSPALSLTLEGQSSIAPQEINYYCGSNDYNAVTYLNPNSPTAISQSIWFSE